MFVLLPSLRSSRKVILYKSHLDSIVGVIVVENVFLVHLRVFRRVRDPAPPEIRMKGFSLATLLFADGSTSKPEQPSVLDRSTDQTHLALISSMA